MKKRDPRTSHHFTQIAALSCTVAKPHPLKHAILIDDEMFYRGQDMYGNQTDEHPCNDRMRGKEDFGKVVIGRKYAWRRPAEKYNSALAEHCADNPGQRHRDHRNIQQPMCSP